MISNVENKPKIILATAEIQIQNQNGEFIGFRAVINPCSTTTIITENAVKMLQLKRTKTYNGLNGVGSIHQSVKGEVFLKIKSNNA